MGRTIPSWRIVVDMEIQRLKKFGEFLRREEKLVVEDLLNQCRLYASYASTLAHPVKELPLIVSMLFAHHKKLMELEKRFAGNNDPKRGERVNVTTLEENR